MNAPVLLRLIWKEFRLLRGFWVAMVVIAVLAQAYVLILLSRPADTVESAFSVALALAALYALGCGATLFATEHETGTYSFQRALPVTAGRVFFGKLAFAGISIPVLIVLLWLMALAFTAGQLPGAGRHGTLWALWGVGALELLAWGVLFSLLVKHPLNAAMLAVLCGSFCAHYLASLTRQYTHVLSLQDYQSALPYRLIVLGLVSAADIVLGLRWFRDTSEPSGQRTVPGPGRLAGGHGVDVRPVRGDCSKEGFARLIWQQWRQSTRLILVLSALVLPLVLVLVWALFASVLFGHDFLGRTSSIMPGLALFLALASACLGGTCVFLADQRKHVVAFLAEHGVPARSVWVSRHLVFGAVALGWTLLVSIPAGLYFMHQDSAELGSEYAFYLALPFGCVLLVYSAGQLCSMFFKSGILAGFFSVFFGLVLLGWAGLMMVLEISWWWSAAPIPLGLLAATWLRTPHWMLGRNGLRGWFSAALLLGVSIVGLLLAVACYRAYEIPLVDPGFSVDEFEKETSAEARRTADMYLRAHDLYVERPARETEPGEDGGSSIQTDGQPSESGTAEWIAENEEAIAVAVEASKRPACDAFTPVRYDARLATACSNLGGLLRTSARQMESEGDLDGALDRYKAALHMSLHLRSRSTESGTADWIEAVVYRGLLKWSTRDGQTPERIRGAIRIIAELTAALPPRETAIKAQYLGAHKALTGDLDSLARWLGYANAPDTRKFIELAITYRLPWERTRAARVMNLNTARELKKLRAVQSAVAHGDAVVFPAEMRHMDWIREWVKTTPFMENMWPQADMAALSLVQMETGRRAVRLQLALKAYQIQNGRLPQALDALVGSYLKEMPIDPYTGEPFRYFPDGVPVTLARRSSYYAKPEVVLAADEPFIWSAGRRAIVVSQDEDPVQKFEIKLWRSSRATHRPNTEYEIWASGEVFPVP